MHLRIQEGGIPYYGFFNIPISHELKHRLVINSLGELED